MAEVESILANKSMPQATDDEQMLIGSALRSPELADRILTAVKLEAIYGAANRAMWIGLQKLRAAGRRTEAMALYEQVVADGHAVAVAPEAAGDAVAPAKVIRRILDDTLTSVGWEAAGDRVRRAWQRRSIIGEFSRVVALAYEGHDPQELVDHIGSAWRDIADAGAPGISAVSAKLGSRRALEAIVRRSKADRAESIRTGIAAIDNFIGGLFPQELSVPAARPSQGKTAFGMQVAEFASRDVTTLFVACEQPEQQLYERSFAAASGVSMFRIRNGRLTDRELELLRAPAERLETHSDLFIFDKPACTVSDIRAAMLAVEKQAGKPPRLVVIDYLQYLLPENRRSPRHEQVAQISRDLKRLAREGNAHVMALAQLNRDADKEAKARPRLSHLGESSAIEKDADLVALIHNPIPDGPVEVSPAEVIFAKNRNGMTGTVELQFRRSATRFESPAAEPDFTPRQYPAPTNGSHSMQGAIDDGDF